MPRYHNSQRALQGDDKLATVLALAGLAQNQQAQTDHAQAQRVSAAMQMLGLMNEQERNAAVQQNATETLGMQKANFQDEARHRQTADTLAGQEANMHNWALTDASARGYQENANMQAHQKAQEAQAASALADSSGQFWGGTLPMEYDRNARLAEGQKNQRDLGVMSEITKAYGTGLPVNPALAHYLGSLDPQLAQAQGAAQQEAEKAQVAKFAALGMGPDGKQPLAQPGTTTALANSNYGPTPAGQDVAPYIPPPEETPQQRQLREQRSSANFNQHIRNLFGQLLSGPNPFSN